MKLESGIKNGQIVIVIPPHTRALQSHNTHSFVFSFIHNLPPANCDHHAISSQPPVCMPETPAGGNKQKELSEGQLVDGWTIMERLGQGVFGAVYLCKSEEFGLCAMKVEQTDAAVQLLGQELVGQGLTPGETHSYIVMTRCGKSLQDLRAERPLQKFSMGTSLALGLQTLEAISQLHTVAGYLHRDIKPANFAIGHGDEECVNVYILDFGLAREFLTPDGRLRRPRDGPIGFRGTLKFASMRGHLQWELCRADDIESWFYMLVEFIKGKLPWSKSTNPDDIYDLKRAARTDGKGRQRLLGGTPRQFMPMLELICALKYYDPPPYERLKELIREAIQATGVKTSPLDWEKPRSGRRSKSLPSTSTKSDCGEKAKSEETKKQTDVEQGKNEETKKQQTESEKAKNEKEMKKQTDIEKAKVEETKKQTDIEKSKVEETKPTDTEKSKKEAGSEKSKRGKKKKHSHRDSSEKGKSRKKKHKHGKKRHSDRDSKKDKSEETKKKQMDSDKEDKGGGTKK